MFMAALFTITKNWKPRCPELTKYDISIPRNTISDEKKLIIDSHNMDKTQRHSAE